MKRITQVIKETVQQTLTVSSSLPRRQPGITAFRKLLDQNPSTCANTVNLPTEELLVPLRNSATL